MNWILRKEESNEICQVESDTALGAFLRLL